jgi:hypothetical protein
MQQEVISRNPNFMSAHLQLAGSYLLQWLAQQGPAAQTLEPAAAAVRRALALNDSYYVNHILLGNIYLFQRKRSAQGVLPS